MLNMKKLTTHFLRVSILLIGLMTMGSSHVSGQAWGLRAELPIGLHRHVAAVSADATGNEKIFVFGGGGESQAFSRNDVYDPVANAWDTTSFLPLPTPRVNATETVGLTGLIYVIGGLIGNSPTDIVEVFDPVNNVWSTIPSMPTPRQAAAAATSSLGNIYVFGGKSIGPGFTAVEMYDPLLMQWSTKMPMPTAQGGAYGIGAELGSDGLIYVMGVDESNPVSSFNYAYDPNSNSWQVKPSVPIPSGEAAQGGRSMTTAGDRIYLINEGQYNSSRDPRAYSYDPVSQTWRREPDTIAGNVSSAAVTIDCKIFEIGGTTRFTLAGLDRQRRVEALLPVWPNSSGCANMFSDGFESGDISAWSSTNPVGYALEFDGVDDFVEVADIELLNAIGSDDFTFEIWFKGLESAQGSHPSFFSNRPGIGVGFVFGLHNAWGGSLHKIPLVQLDGRNWIDPSTPQYLDGQWHHFAATRSEETLTYYMDGLMISSWTSPLISAATIAANHSLLIGHDQLTATFGGSLDQPCIWNVSRTQEQIKAGMLGNIGSDEPGLVACWRLNEGLGQSAGDLTPISQDGVLGTGSDVDDTDPLWVAGVH